MQRETFSDGIRIHTYSGGEKPYKIYQGLIGSAGIILVACFFKMMLWARVTVVKLRDGFIGTRGLDYTRVKFDLVGQVSSAV